MKTLLTLCAVTLLASALRADDPPKKEEWKQLFNGKNLDGWTPKIKGYEYGDNFGDTFRVVDGNLQVSYDKYKKFDENYGHLFYKDKFSHYRLRVEYRFVGKQVDGGPGWAQRNSGAMLHCQDPKTMGKDQLFPVSIEAQFLGGLGKGERPTGSMCSPGTNVVMNGKLITQHCVNSKSKTYNGDQWVTIEMEVHGGGKVKHVVDGQTVIEYEQPQLDPKDMDARKLIKDEKNLLLTEGYISLQAESAPVEFRKVEILVLPK